MLKITITETPSERRWTLQGRLVGPWVDELRNSWKNQQHSPRGQRCVIDLCDVTFIDKSGERLLRAIAKKGFKILAAGVYTKHVLERLNGNGKTQISNRTRVATKKANSEKEKST